MSKNLMVYSITQTDVAFYRDVCADMIEALVEGSVHVPGLNFKP